jgi:hypothetical protein
MFEILNSRARDFADTLVARLLEQLSWWIPGCLDDGAKSLTQTHGSGAGNDNSVVDYVDLVIRQNLNQPLWTSRRSRHAVGAYHRTISTADTNQNCHEWLPLKDTIFSHIRIRIVDRFNEAAKRLRKNPFDNRFNVSTALELEPTENCFTA